MKIENRKRPKGCEFLTTIPAIYEESRPIPGFDRGPHSLLRFVLKVLDGEHTAIVGNHLASLLAYDFQFQTPESISDLKRLNADRALLEAAARAMISAMRKMADMWISSGKSPSDPGWDSPTQRNVEDVLPGHDYSLFQFLDRTLLRNHPRYLGMRRDGSLGFKDTFPRFYEDESPALGLRERMQKFGAKFAAFWFSRLLNSPDSRRIARCDGCKAYFAYERTRLREVKRGVYCARPDCKTKASVKRTKASRNERIETAATGALEWTPEKPTDRAQWIADRVSEKHSITVGRRWVSQHSPEIQERVEALRNAKS